MTRARTTTVATLCLAAGLGCASAPRWPRSTRVDREERVACPVTICDRWFATLYGVQSVFAVAELSRLDAWMPLLLTLGVGQDADPGRAGEALRALMGQRSLTALPYRVRVGEHADAAIGRWREALEAGQRAPVDALLREVEAAITVRWGDAQPPEGMTRVRPALEAYLRRSLAIERVAAAAALIAEQLERDRPAVTAAAPRSLAPEYDAATRYLASVRVRSAGQVHESRRAGLWVRGLIAPEEDDDDFETSETTAR